MKPAVWIGVGILILIVASLGSQRYRNYLKKIPFAAERLGKKYGAKTDQHLLLRSMNSFFYIVGMAVTLVGIFIAINMTFFNTPPVEIHTKPQINQSDDTLSSRDIFNLVNQERKSRGVKELYSDNRLTGIAQARLDDMVENQYYAHLNPNGKYYYDLFPEYLIKADYSCENLDVEFTTDEGVYINDWLTSTKGHKECMLNENVTSAGYAVGLFSDTGSAKVYIVVGIHATSISVLSTPITNTELAPQ